MGQVQSAICFVWPTQYFGKKNASVSCPHLKIGRVPLKKSGFPFSNNNNKSKHFCVAHYVPGAVLDDLCLFSPLILRTVPCRRCLCYQPPPAAGETEAGGDPGCSWLCMCLLGAGHTPSTRPGLSRPPELSFLTCPSPGSSEFVPS